MSVITQTPVLETLSLLKDEGKIGSFGVSTYTIEGGKKAVELCDCVMVAYNKSYLDELPVIACAREKGKAVLVKKGLASGHTGRLGDIGENIRFVAGTAGVTSLVFGSLTPGNIVGNARAFSHKK